MKTGLCHRLPDVLLTGGGLLGHLAHGQGQQALEPLGVLTKQMGIFEAQGLGKGKAALKVIGPSRQIMPH